MRERHQLLAALATFSVLEEENKDISSILKDFIIFIIQYKKLNCFSRHEIQNMLKEEFYFDIPISVIFDTIKEIEGIDLNTNKSFIVTPNFKPTNQKIEDVLKNKANEETKLFTSLYSHIEADIDENEKQIIKETFLNAIINNPIDKKYQVPINAFIIKNKDNALMKEVASGILIYDGLMYKNTTMSKYWQGHKLKIYLNMEIIFHLMGYNGLVWKQLFDEMFELIVETNRNKKVIDLVYTSKERERIEDFFESTKKSIRNINKDTKDATLAILKKCQNNKFQIDMELENLFKILKSQTILEDVEKENFEYTEYAQQYNIVSQQLLKDFEDIENVENVLEMLNFINIKRANRRQDTIENVGYIFLTEVIDINKISQHIQKDNTDKTMPLSINMANLTKILWFKLGKGFGRKLSYPISFDIATKAKCALALQNNQKINEMMEQISEKYNEENKDILQQTLYRLQTKKIKPEDIDENNVSSIVKMTTADIDYFIDTQQKKDKKHKDTEQQLETSYEKRKMEKFNEWLSFIRYQKKFQYILYILCGVFSFVCLCIAILILLLPFLSEIIENIPINIPMCVKRIISSSVIGIIEFVVIYKYIYKVFKSILKNIEIKTNKKISTFIKQQAKELMEEYSLINRTKNILSDFYEYCKKYYKEMDFLPKTIDTK